MKIHLFDLNPSQNVTLSGDEDWLAPIYKDFPLPEGANQAQDKISGQLTITKLTDDVVRVQGSLGFKPQVPCSRCDRAIAWPLDMPIDTYYQRRTTEDLGRDITLRKAELDEYYFSGEEIDLAELVNDTVQTALPTQFLPREEDAEACHICGLDLSTDQVYGKVEEEDDDEHPFAGLKDLKLKN